MTIHPPPAPQRALTDAFFLTWKDDDDTTWRRAYFLTTDGYVSYADLSTDGTWESQGRPLPIAKFWTTYPQLGTTPAAAAVVVNGLPWFITPDHQVLKPHENATAADWDTKKPTTTTLTDLFFPPTPECAVTTACVELSTGGKAVVFNRDYYTLANLQTSTDPSPDPQKLGFTAAAALLVHLGPEEATFLLDGTTWRHTTPNLHIDPKTGGADWSKFSLDPA
ncbi:hypothetical protein [Streptomyces griseus]|uniref:hypothetical protein n=1 Tax=Streptomyces griseus TaxID=1911 RepID=UPI0036A66830